MRLGTPISCIVKNYYTIFNFSVKSILFKTIYIIKLEQINIIIHYTMILQNKNCHINRFAINTPSTI